MDFEVRRIAQEPTGRADRGRRRRERSNRDARLEALHQFFQNEHRPGDWGVEGRREAGARPGCTKRSTISPGETKCTTDEDAYARAQLNARPFAPKGKTRADREDPADELDRRQAVGGRRKLPLQHGLDMGNSAASRMSREPFHQPGRGERRRGAYADEEQQSDDRFVSLRNDQFVAKSVCPIK